MADSRAAGLVKNVLDLLFPLRCAVCGVSSGSAKRTVLCPPCLATVTWIEAPLCRSCGLELHGEPDRQQLCGECLAAPPPFSVARSVVRYDGVVRQLVQNLKYHGDYAVLPAFRELVAGYDLSVFADCRWIVPVPLHRRRLRWRGLNQAVVLAGIFFPDRSKDLAVDWLVRVKNTIPQTGLDGAARRNNLRHAFFIRPVAKIAGTKVCLVDDVYTTGTTARSCCKALLSGGAEEVKVLTMARVAIAGRGRWQPASGKNEQTMSI